MELERIREYNNALAETDNLSNHNKEVIEEFVKYLERNGNSKADIRGQMSRLSVLSRIINFKLDQAEREDIKNLVGKVNSDELRKKNGEKYSSSSRESFWKTISRFYRSFIDREGRGFREDLDGYELLDGIQIKYDKTFNVNSEEIPKPRHIKKAVEAADSLRNKAVILFNWATGCRVGELYKTEDDPEPIKWRDIKFGEDKMWIKTSEEGTNTRGKGGENRIPVRISMPIRRKLQDEKMENLDDPVFKQEVNMNYCPKCDSRAVPTKDVNRKASNYRNRLYSCKGCEWDGEQKDTVLKKKPLTDSAVRRLVEKSFDNAEISRRIKRNPHDAFRKSRALYKAYIGWTEYQLRAFFNWSPNSDAPKHYIEIAKEGLEKALMEEFGTEYEPDIDEDKLKPLECENCGTINSVAWSYCQKCERELDEELRLHNKEKEEEQRIKKKAYQHGLEYIVENQGVEREEVFEEVNEFMGGLIRD